VSPGASGRITRNWLEAFSATWRLGKIVRLRMLNIQSRRAAPWRCANAAALS
jgi:hypothetical protein